MKFFFILLIFFINFSQISKAEFVLKKIIDLNNPWGSSFIDEDRLIVTEKSGNIKLVNVKSKNIINIEHNLNYLEHGQGGLLDILFKNSYVYISYSENRGNLKTSTSIARAKFDKKKLYFEQKSTTL